MGELNKANKYLLKAIEYSKKIEDKSNMHDLYEYIGVIQLKNKDYKIAKKYLEESNDLVPNCYITKLFLYLTYKAIGKKYNINELISLIKKTEGMDYYLNYHICLLLEDASYLKTAYKQVQEMAVNLEPDVAAKFLNYPIPKAIVEEWEKVK